ncbi:MAG: tetratricopeptide repeat protein [Candidatus Riflebacteria bacterium]|nr:tetratricopeptide repeat protein [Candidatus Riflebacteria bacterium]
MFCIVFSGILLLPSPAIARAKNATATVPIGKPGEQDILLKAEVLEFMRKHSDRKMGEGYLFLAQHYKALEQPDRALALLQTLVRSEPAGADEKAEAQLLMAEILEDQKEYDRSLKELDRLIEWSPERSYLVKAKIQRAKLMGRGLTKITDLFKAYRRYYEKFPECSEREEMRYLIGFERGYDLEIGMHGLTAWEEIASYSETDAADLAKLHIGLFYAYDLNKPERGIEWLSKIASDSKSESAINVCFVNGALSQYHLATPNPQDAVLNYREYLKSSKDLLGWRTAHLMLGSLLRDELSDCPSALEVFAELATVPPHLTATPSLSLKKRREAEIDDMVWGILGLKMAGYTAEYKLGDPDRAKYYYEKATQLDKDRVGKSGGEADPWLGIALARTEPKISPAQILFEKAYEKYRGRDLQSALTLFDTFIASYPNHAMVREAQYRAAVITDDDMREYDKALGLYEQYLVGAAPKKSSWQLDKIYDWGRVDEVRYRIGNLKSLHQRDPVGAIESFAALLSAWPDSYWAMQGLKDTIRLQKETLQDDAAMQDSMKSFVERFPDSKDAQTYRKDLYKTLLDQEKPVDALKMLRDYLDHALPSDEGYLDDKKAWRELSFRLREAEIQDRLKRAGSFDRQNLYNELIPVLALATSSEPLEKLAKELEDAEMPDDLRWTITYRIGVEMYREFPGKAKALLEKLADTASGPAKLACALSLGNIAWRIDKSLGDAARWYEIAASITKPLDPLFETPFYRLGRITLAQGEGIKAVDMLTRFTREYPRSRHLARAYFALGEAYAGMHHPESAHRFYGRALRLSPALADKVKDRLEALKKIEGPEAWLAGQAIQREKTRKREADARQRKREGLESASGSLEIPSTRESDQKRENAAEEETGDEGATASAKLLAKLGPEELETRYQKAVTEPKPDVERIAKILIALIKSKADDRIRERAIRRYISWSLLREPRHQAFVTEVQELLTSKNYPEQLSELLYRMAEVSERSLKNNDEANRAYFEYLSFFPEGRRVQAVRERIPQVYDAANDGKNALRFYQKLIDDAKIPAEVRVDASVRKSKLEEKDEKKDEAIKTLEAALSLESSRRPELYLRLERLTDVFDNVQRALDAPGDEEPRFKALRRLVKKAEEDKDQLKAVQLITKYKAGFSMPESLAWIDKKSDDLGKRGTISGIEEQIEQNPEDPQTPSRLFKLGQMVEGVENTKYRSQDLFYEITLVYPRSEFFKESKIRAENTRAIKSIEELTALLKKGVKTGEGDEILLERARLYRDALQDPSHAWEDYEALLKLFPDSPRRDEAFLGLGEIALSKEHDSDRAAALWETGLSVARDPKNRSDLLEHLEELKKFHQYVLYSDKRADQEDGEMLIFRLWRVDGQREFALGLLQEALEKIENRPNAAKLYFLVARLLEELNRPEDAAVYYERALRSFVHPGLRKDLVIYRWARLQRSRGDKTGATELFTALVNRYPRSRYCRSALFWLYKEALAAGRLVEAHDFMSRLLDLGSLIPSHRKELDAKFKDLSARVELAGMKKLQESSRDGGVTFSYYTAKMLEHDLRDYDRAIKSYEEYLKSSPPAARSRDVLYKMAELAEKKGDYVRAVEYLDTLRKSMKPSPENLSLIIRIGDLVEDRLISPDLAKLFYETILDEYNDIHPIRDFAKGKLARYEEKRMAKAEKPKGGKKAKREYTEDDQAIIDSIEDIQKKDIDDLQDYPKADKDLVGLWGDNPDSAATFEIMKALVEMNDGPLMDPQKAAEYYERWIAENPGDRDVPEITMKLYDLYMDKVRDGQKALKVLETFVRDNPTSPLIMEAQFKLAKANELLVLNYDEARRAYQRIIDTRMNTPIVHESYYRMGFVMRDGFADYANAIRLWDEMNNLFYNNTFAAAAQYEIAYTYEVFQRDYTKARDAYEKFLNSYPNSPLQNKVREALLRIGGKR